MGKKTKTLKIWNILQWPFDSNMHDWQILKKDSSYMNLWWYVEMREESWIGRTTNVIQNNLMVREKKLETQRTLYDCQDHKDGPHVGSHTRVLLPSIPTRIYDLMACKAHLGSLTCLLLPTNFKAAFVISNCKWKN